MSNSYDSLIMNDFCIKTQLKGQTRIHFPNIDYQSRKEKKLNDYFGITIAICYVLYLININQRNVIINKTSPCEMK